VPDLQPVTDGSGHYFTIDEFRASQLELEDVTAFPTALLEQKRDEAEEDWEAVARKAFFPRTATITAYPCGKALYLHHRSVRAFTSVKLNGVEIATDTSPADITVDSNIGALVRSTPWADGIYTVTYTHGADSPNAAVKRVVLMLARIYAVPSSIDPRATAVINSDVGGYRISVADSTGRTGIPDIDAAAARYGDRVPQVG